MAGMSDWIRERTNALDAAGNTTAAIGKGFAIGSAALVSLALFGAYVSRVAISIVDVLTPKVFIGLIVNAMLPYWFSAMTMKSVGSAALKMVEEVRRQFNTIPGPIEGTAKPDYATFVKVSMDGSIKEMIPPSALVMLTPLIFGTYFGVETLSGVLAGSLVFGVQAGASEHTRTIGPKGSDPHRASVIGDTIGDPLSRTHPDPRSTSLSSSWQFNLWSLHPSLRRMEVSPSGSFEKKRSLNPKINFIKTNTAALHFFAPSHYENLHHPYFHLNTFISFSLVLLYAKFS